MQHLGRCSYLIVQKLLKMLASSCQIMREILEHKIKIYEFPETGDEEENRLVKKIKVKLSVNLGHDTELLQSEPSSPTRTSCRWL